GGKKLEQIRRLVNAAQQQYLDERAQRGHEEPGGENAAPKAETSAHLEGKGRREIQPQHVQRAVGDVDDAGDAKDERQAGAHEKQARRGGEAVERLEQKGFETHAASARRYSALSARGGGRLIGV